MIYLSKGIWQRETPGQLSVLHCGQDFQLTGAEAALWLKGRFSFSVTSQPKENQALAHLEQLGLVETEADDSAAARYRILTRCICCPAKAPGIPVPVRGIEKVLLFWLKHAGIRLTVAELVFLTEHQIQPEPGLLSEANRQALVEAIYTQENIADNLLENQMEQAASRDAVIQGLLGLLEKRRILIL